MNRTESRHPKTAPAIGFHNVSKDFITPSGESFTAIRGITLDVPDGAFITVVGPTGCGKSTLLNMAAGLLAPGGGEVRVFGEPLRGLNRHAAYLFQQDALLPWRTVLDNVTLGLLFRGETRKRAQEHAREWLRRVGLAGFEDRYPHQLSGGMRKRVALAQTWIVDPRILLMDEPFSALDVQTRQIMENELLRLWAETRKTVLFVTHDLEEAIALADRVAVLSAPPTRLIGVYDVDLPRPRNVAEIRMERDFADLYRKIWSDLKGEVQKSYEQRLA